MYHKLVSHIFINKMYTFYCFILFLSFLLFVPIHILTIPQICGIKTAFLTSLSALRTLLTPLIYPYIYVTLVSNVSVYVV